MPLTTTSFSIQAKINIEFGFLWLASKEIGNCTRNHFISTISATNTILASPIEYLKGLARLGQICLKELELFTFNDLLQHYPIRHIDKTKVSAIADINFQTEYIQVAGRLIQFDIIGEKRAKRLVAQIKDASGILELTWFQGISWVQKSLYIGSDYLVFGKTTYFNGKPQIVHPEIEVLEPTKMSGKAFLEPVYPSTEKLKARGLNGRQLAKFTYTLFQQLTPKIYQKIFHKSTQ